jgi:hypothetical protein
MNEMLVKVDIQCVMYNILNFLPNYMERQNGERLVDYETTYFVTHRLFKTLYILHESLNT